MHNAHGRKSGIPGDDMNIVCIGGGPAGLYFGLLMKLHDPGSEVTIVERNRPYDTFGWGVVFSDATLDNLKQDDTVSAERISAALTNWDYIEIHYKGQSENRKRDVAG